MVDYIADFNVLSLVFWLVGFGSRIHHTSFPQWVDRAQFILIFALPVLVDALATGLIVFKIFKVYWEAKTSYGRTCNTTGGSKLRSIIFILIESGIALFSIQLAMLVLYYVSTDVATYAYQVFCFNVYPMLIVIISSHSSYIIFTDSMCLARA